jgi:hypothetical protein
MRVLGYTIVKGFDIGIEINIEYNNKKDKLSYLFPKYKSVILFFFLKNRRFLKRNVISEVIPLNCLVNNKNLYTKVYFFYL